MDRQAISECLTELTGAQLRVASVDDLKAYADHETVIALVSALAKTRPVANQVRIPQRLFGNLVAMGTWVKDMHHRNRTPQSVDWDVL